MLGVNHSNSLSQSPETSVMLEQSMHPMNTWLSISDKFGMIDMRKKSSFMHIFSVSSDVRSILQHETLPDYVVLTTDKHMMFMDMRYPSN